MCPPHSRRFAVKAVLYRHTGLPAGKDYDKIVLTDNAMTLVVVDEIVTVKRSGGDTIAAVKLSEHDHIKFED
jgi:hypothetical protein